MSSSYEELWGAMKPAHYDRLADELASKIRYATDDKKAISEALDGVVEAIHAVAGTFWFYDRFEDGRIHPLAVYGGSDISDFSLAPGEGIAGQVIEKAQSTIIQDCQKDARWANKVDKDTGFVTRSMICVPLCIEDGIAFGCMQIINKKDGMLFDRVDMALVEKLAELVGNHLSERNFVGSYQAYFKREPLDMNIYVGEVFMAPTKAMMKREFHTLDLYHLLKISERGKADKLAAELYDIFRTGVERKAEKDRRRKR